MFKDLEEEFTVNLETKMASAEMAMGGPRRIFLGNLGAKKTEMASPEMAMGGSRRGVLRQFRGRNGECRNSDGSV